MIPMCLGLAVQAIPLQTQQQQLHSQHEKSGSLVCDLLRIVGEQASHEGNPSMGALLEVLRKENVVGHCGSDDLRIPYVTLQCRIEEALAEALGEGRLIRLEGVIHTPSPSTPLCANAEQSQVEALMDPSIAKDTAKKRTVSSRAVVLRTLLEQGGVLHIAYPQAGLSKRTDVQQDNYRKLLELYPGHLIDRPLTVEGLDEDMIGATYTFFDIHGCGYAFSIKARQANDPSESSQWAVWFGSLDHPDVRARVDSVFQHLSGCGFMAYSSMTTRKPV